MQIDTKIGVTSSDVILTKKGEKHKFNKKKGVELVMKYRNYKDPLFYDKDANDRIFVPTTSVRQTKSLSCSVGDGPH